MTQEPRKTPTQEFIQEPSQTTIYTAASCQGKPGPGGYAALIQTACGEELIRRGYEQETNQLQMSLKAVAHALEALRAMPSTPGRITVHADSKYLSDAFGKQWVTKWREAGWKTGRGESMEAPQDWENLMRLTQDLEILWAPLRGRNEHPGNHRAERLAEEMAEMAAASQDDASRNLNIYVSGITHEETRVGGFAALIETPGNDRIVRGGEHDAASSRMKLQAIIMALREVQADIALDPTANPRLRIHTRSRYIIETMNQGWIQRWQQNGWLTNRGEDVKNQDLWKEMLAQTDGLDINWIWSKAHTTNPPSELCYSIAQEELDAIENCKIEARDGH